jgi:hypothetical protein
MRAPTFACSATVGLVLALGALAACQRDPGAGEPPAIQTRRDAQGNEHIDINKQQVKKNLDQAGRELRQDAHRLGDAVRQSADELAHSDTALTARVKARLLAAPDLGGVHIDVESKDGHVILRGQVASADRKSDAEKIALRTKGVVSVDNQLSVGGG